MALAHADRVKETSTTTGTGTYDLAGAVTGFQGFVAGIGDGNTCYYVAENGTDWEVGLGTVTDASPDTLARTSIIASSNAGSAVNWGAGTKYLYVTGPASKYLPRDEGLLITDLGVTVQAFDADTAKLDVENQTVTGGGSITPKDLGTISSGTLTLDVGDRMVQKYTNNGAHTFAPGTVKGTCVVDITMDASAGTITTTGWTVVKGDSFTTTSGHKFHAICVVTDAGSSLTVIALQ